MASNDFQDDVQAIQSIESVPIILKVVRNVTGMRFAAVARVTGKDWVCLAVDDDLNFGLLPGGTLELETTLCHEVRQSRKLIVIENVAEDVEYCDHHTPHHYGFQSYLSVPIFLKDGSFYGTLCAIDPKPAKLPGIVLETAELFARLIGMSLDTLERTSATEELLADAEELSDLREKFIAILAHDLRNPISALSSGVRLVRRSKDAEKSAYYLDVMERSLDRMTELTESVLDFARGRLGSGIHLNRTSEPIEASLWQVVAEMETVHSERRIECAFDVKEPVNGDRSRLAQLFLNLLGNALTYGEKTKPVTVAVESGNGEFRLSVANTGKTIGEEQMSRLFEAFSRGDDNGNHGLGLGLYIANEIAKAHCGKIEVSSTGDETRFTFVMPL